MYQVKQDGTIPLPDGKDPAYNEFRISRRPAAARTAVGLLDGAWDNQNSTAGGKNCKSRFRILKPVFVGHAVVLTKAKLCYKMKKIRESMVDVFY